MNWNDPYANTNFLQELWRLSDDCLLETSPIAQLKALHFDGIKDSYYEPFIFKPKSADALYIVGDEWYLIEFKRGEMNRVGLFRKAYDSAIVLVEHCGRDWKFCQEHLHYIVVGREADKRFSENEPPNTDPRIVAGQVVKDAAVMNVSKFESFMSGLAAGTCG